MKLFTKIALIIVWPILFGPFLAFGGFVVWHAPLPWKFVFGVLLLASTAAIAMDCRKTWRSVNSWPD